MTERLSQPDKSSARPLTHRDASDQDYQLANVGTPDQQIAYMLFAIWHELRHIGDLLTPPPTKGI